VAVHRQYGPAVNSVLLFILFVLLGWKVFGSRSLDG